MLRLFYGDSPAGLLSKQHSGLGLKSLSYKISKHFTQDVLASFVSVSPLYSKPKFCTPGLEMEVDRTVWALSLVFERRHLVHLWAPASEA